MMCVGGGLSVIAVRILWAAMFTIVYMGVFVNLYGFEGVWMYVCVSKYYGSERGVGVFMRGDECDRVMMLCSAQGSGGDTDCARNMDMQGHTELYQVSPEKYIPLNRNAIGTAC